MRFPLRHALNSDVKPYYARHRQQEQEHPGGGPPADAFQQVTEYHRAEEAAQPTEHSDHATHDTDFGGEILGDVLVHARLADPHGDADDEDENGKDPDIGLEEGGGDSIGAVTDGRADGRTGGRYVIGSAPVSPACPLCQ